MIKLLAVDDSALLRKLIGQVFAEEADFEVSFARNGIEALAMLPTYRPDVITLDVHMPQMDGLACLDRIMVERPTPVVMVSTLTAEGAEATLEALRLGAVDFAAKPSGAISLHMDEWGPMLVKTVRSAAGARLRTAHRLKDRVRHRIGAAPKPRMRLAANSVPSATGEGMVLVGTSTGGPPALEALLTALPSDFPWPIVIAQHMPASFTGSLARRLDNICEIGVSEVLAPQKLHPGQAYIGRGDADVIVSKRGEELFVMAAPSLAGYPWHPSADRLVRSAMECVAPNQLVGVLMTGMGDDGAKAMTRLHHEGGRTIAEAEETAVVWGMPGELVKGGGADFIEALPNIAARLRKLVPCP